MDAWMSYIRTRESILSKHYTEESLFLSASRGHAKSRSLTDSLLVALRPLSRVDFHLDLLYETRLLHESLLQLAVSLSLHYSYFILVYNYSLWFKKNNNLSNTSVPTILMIYINLEIINIFYFKLQIHGILKCYKIFSTTISHVLLLFLHYHLWKYIINCFVKFQKLPLSPSGSSEITTDSLLLKKIVQSIKSGLSGGNTSSEDHSLASGEFYQKVVNIMHI